MNSLYRKRQLNKAGLHCGPSFEVTWDVTALFPFLWPKSIWARVVFIRINFLYCVYFFYERWRYADGRMLTNVIESGRVSLNPDLEHSQCYLSEKMYLRSVSQQYKEQKHIQNTYMVLWSSGWVLFELVYLAHEWTRDKSIKFQTSFKSVFSLFFLIFCSNFSWLLCSHWYEISHEVWNCYF